MSRTLLPPISVEARFFCRASARKAVINLLLNPPVCGAVIIHLDAPETPADRYLSGVMLLRGFNGDLMQAPQMDHAEYIKQMHPDFAVLADAGFEFCQPTGYEMGCDRVYLTYAGDNAKAR